jgi:manganese/zinc/iron transport system permease protein
MPRHSSDSISSRGFRDPLASAAGLLLAALLLGCVTVPVWWTGAWRALLGWSGIDWTIVIAGALAAAACAIPGCFLVVRRQSMMGDAISHSALPGVVLAFLATYWLLPPALRLDPVAFDALSRLMMFLGAIVVGIACALLTEWVQRLGNVDGSAALGVVFTTLFALGLLLLRARADDVHIDPDCVLYGTLEKVAMEAALGARVPPAIWVTGISLVANALLVTLFFKELKIAAFDPQLATSLGIPARGMHYALMACTAATLVAAFESVGSILVIAMLIAPAATAYLLTERLQHMIGLSLVFAVACSLLGHVLALLVPDLLLRPLGITGVEAVNSAGMMATAAGLLFAAAVFLAPRHGLVTRAADRLRLAVRIASEDLLGFLYRSEEQRLRLTRDELMSVLETAVGGGVLNRLALRYLRHMDAITCEDDRILLTDRGRSRARRLVRSHRLWESYMDKHFELGRDHLHDTAAKVEHFIDRATRDQLADELNDTPIDAHGTRIPPEG